MPEFLNPFPGVTPGRKLTDREIVRGIRLALAAEHEAVHLYEALADATDNEMVKDVLQDIADEEKVHAGEFLRVLSRLLPDEDGFLAQGAAEVDELAAKTAPAPAAEEKPVEEKPVPTVGGLRKS